MNRARLALLAARLETVPEEFFSMTEWAKLTGGEIFDKGIRKPECGTRACAAGWACSVPEFNKAGLYMVESYEFGEKKGTPKFGDSTSWHAVRQFFEIDHGLATRIFAENSTRGNTPRDVTRTIYEALITGF